MMGGRGGSSGLSSGLYSRNSIAKELPDSDSFKMRELPELEGSQKQIDWATKIRQRVLNSLMSYATGYQSDGHGAIGDVVGKTKNEIAESIQKRIEGAESKKAKDFQKSYAIERYKDIAERVKRVNEVASVRSSSWWINYNQKYEFKFGQSEYYRNQQFKKYIDRKIKLKNPLPT